MRKRIPLILLSALLGGAFGVQAQELFNIPDTVCIRQPVSLTSNAPSSAAHYWNFCSGYLNYAPEGVNLGQHFGLDDPGAMDIVRDGDLYYGFVINRGTRSLLRLEFGNSLSGTPSVTDLGNLNLSVPEDANAITLIRDEENGSWFAIASGGSSPANASYARFDFGDNLSRIPNSINFGNPGSVLSAPGGVVAAKDRTGRWYSFMVDYQTGYLLRLDFGANLGSTPQLDTFRNVGNMNGPTDMAILQERGRWYMVVTNGNSNSLTVVYTDSLLGNRPQGMSTGNMDTVFAHPSGITLSQDCGITAAIITNRDANTISKVLIPSITGFFRSSLIGPVGELDQPADITRIIRSRDTLFGFVVNAGNNTLSSVRFAQCTDASAASSTAYEPETFSYSRPGIYNIHLTVNEGQPDMQSACRQIVVLGQPPLTVSEDTIICQGEAAALSAVGYRGQKYTWTPNYNISDTQGMHVYAAPEYATTYTATIEFENGCIWDTAVYVDVVKIRADAGPDRTLTDGDETILGGPMTSDEAGRFAYRWIPETFLSDPNIKNPVAKPAYTITYLLQVTTLGAALNCVVSDGVLVNVYCNDLNLPNVFAPESIQSGSGAFGLMNRQIVKLNFFRIYDRWGNLVFYTTDPAKQWDGRINGEYPPTGVFVWEADGFCLTGERIHKKGNVTLLR